MNLARRAPEGAAERLRAFRRAEVMVACCVAWPRGREIEGKIIKNRRTSLTMHPKTDDNGSKIEISRKNTVLERPSAQGRFPDVSREWDSQWVIC